MMSLNDRQALRQLLLNWRLWLVLPPLINEALAALGFVPVMAHRLTAGADTFTFNALAATLTNKTISGGTFSGTIADTPTYSGVPTFSSNVTVSGTLTAAGATLNGMNTHTNRRRRQYRLMAADNTTAGV